MNRAAAITAALLIALSLSAAHAEPVLQFPNRYAVDMAVAQCPQPPVFECDAASRTCFRGYRLSTGAAVGEVLAEDRSTVLAHVMVRARDDWISYDDGCVYAPEPVDHHMVCVSKAFTTDLSDEATAKGIARITEGCGK
jgi:hypothetical protein